MTTIFLLILFFFNQQDF